MHDPGCMVGVGVVGVTGANTHTQVDRVASQHHPSLGSLPSPYGQLPGCPGQTAPDMTS